MLFPMLLKFPTTPTEVPLVLKADIVSNNKSKIKFQIDKGTLISKVIDGRFPDYSKVVPKNNDKTLHNRCG